VNLWPLILLAVDAFTHYSALPVGFVRASRGRPSPNV